MAFTNIETGKIYGAKKGTLNYYHEKGHLAFSKHPKGEITRYREEVSKDFLIVICSLTLLFPMELMKIALGYSLVRWLYFYYYEEVWCWIYAFKIKKRKNATQKV